MQTRRGRIFIAGTIFIITALVAIILISRKQSHSLSITSSWVSHTNDVLYHTQKVLNSITEIETNSRGFALSGNSSYLLMLNEAEKKLNEELDMLHKLTNDNPEQQQRVDSLVSVAHERVRVSRQVADARRYNSLLAAEKITSKGEGKYYMGIVRQIIYYIDSTEKDRLAKRQLANNRAISRMNNIFYGTILISIILLLFIFQLISQELNNRRKANKKIQGLLESAPDAIIILDHHHRIQMVNQETEKIFGYKKTELHNKPITLLMPLPQEIRDYKPVEIRNTRKDGSVFTAEVRISPMETEEENLLALSVRDITERKRIEERLRIFNEELEEKVKTKTNELRGIVERITDSFIALDKNMCYTYVNRMAGELIKKDPESLIGKNVWEVFPDAVGSATYHAFVKAMEEQHYTSNIDYYPPLDLWQENHLYPSPDGLSVFIRDISKQKRAEAILQREEEIRKLIINAALDAIVCMDTNGFITAWNPQAEKVFGWKESEVTGKELAAVIIPEKYRERHKQGLKRYRETGVSTMIGHLIEITALNEQGLEFPVELIITKVEHAKDEFFCAFIRDITQRKNTEALLKKSYEDIRMLASHLQEVREEERTSIAREIHDELGQQLTGLKIDLAAIAQKTDSAEEKAKILGAISITDEIINTVRKIATELRPSILDDFGLLDALHWQSAEFEKRYSIETRFNTNLESLKLPSNIVTGLFRIYQESLTNVARHSKAATILSSLDLQDDKLVLSISDNGTGFDKEKISGKRTLGILGMKERTSMMGGEYQISSSPGQGTTVTVSIPFNNN